MNEVTTVPEADPTLAVAELPRDLAVIKMENDNIMALAAAHPRNYAVILQDLKTQLQTYKSFAMEATYSKPCGKDSNQNQTYARGLSIRAAEAIAEAYGYNRCSVDVTPIDDTTARVEASFVDFQRGRVWRRSVIVSKVFKRKGGGLGRHNDDRFNNVVCQAEGSKQLRECIIRSVPPGLRSELLLCVDEQLAEFLDENTVLNIIAQFSSKGVSKEDLERMIGKRIESFTRDDRVKLMEVWRGVESGDVEPSTLRADGNSEEKPQGSRAEQLADQLAPKAAPDPPAPPGPTTTNVPPPDPALEPAPKADEQIGDGDLYQRIAEAYTLIPAGAERAKVRELLGLKLITDCKRMTSVEANDALIVITDAGKAVAGAGA